MGPKRRSFTKEPTTPNSRCLRRCIRPHCFVPEGRPGHIPPRHVCTECGGWVTANQAAHYRLGLCHARGEFAVENEGPCPPHRYIKANTTPVTWVCDGCGHETGDKAARAYRDALADTVIGRPSGPN